MKRLLFLTFVALFLLQACAGGQPADKELGQESSQETSKELAGEPTLNDGGTTTESESECSTSKPCEGGLLCKDGRCSRCDNSVECGSDKLCAQGICIEPECSSSKPCADGRLCKDSQCVDCNNDGECEQGKICGEGSCLEAECSDQKACQNGTVCTQGRCTKCTDDKACPQGSICEEERCVQGCRDSKGCANGTVCLNSEKRCVACLNNKGCSDGKVCRNSACVACRGDQECESGQLCLSGKCAQGDCRTSSDCGTQGQLCKNNQCTGCQSDTECKGGWICDSSLCRAGCRKNGDCQNNQVCDTKTNLCIGCNSNKDCQSGQICKNKSCRACSSNTECSTGQICVSGRCLVGNCKQTKDCKNGQVCVKNKCSACTTDTQCSASQLCLRGACKTGDCRNEKDCSNGVRCRENKCGFCKSGADCGAGQRYLSTELKKTISQPNSSIAFVFDKLPFPSREIRIKLISETNSLPGLPSYFGVYLDGAFLQRLAIPSFPSTPIPLEISPDAAYDGKLTIEIRSKQLLRPHTFRVSLEYVQGALCVQNACKKGNCLKASDCSQSPCRNAGTVCNKLSHTCKQNRCITSQTSYSTARCSLTEKRCLVYLGMCRESLNGASVVSTAYNKESDKQKYLPSGFKYVRSFNDSGTDGHAYHATSKHGTLTVCHYGIRGLPKITSLDALRQQISALRNIHSVTCSTAKGTKIGSCAGGVYQRLKGLRKAGLLTHIINTVKQGKCKGGLRLDGHSMGGAVVSLLAAELYLTDSKTFNKDFMRVYTYGQIRQFKTSEADKFHKLITKRRWVNEEDYAPGFPPSGFKHYGSTRLLRSSSNESKSQNYAPPWSITDGWANHNSLRYLDRLKKCK